MPKFAFTLSTLLFVAILTAVPGGASTPFGEKPQQKFDISTVQINAFYRVQTQNTPAWGRSGIHVGGCLHVQECVEVASDSIHNVANAAELRAALSSAAPGDTILLASGDYDGLWLRNEDFSAGGDSVVIASAESGNPASFSGMDLNNVTGLTFSGIVFDYTYEEGTVPHHVRPFKVASSEDISFVGCRFDGDVARNTGDVYDGGGAGYGLAVTESRGIAVADSDFSTLYKGLTIVRSDDVEVTGNAIHHIRSDGLNLAGVQGAVVTGNHFHDFVEVEGSGDHWDMIQIFSNNHSRPTTDVVISDNMFDLADGTRTQTIWIRNEMVDKGAAGEEMFYRNIEITDNLIVNGHRHGIAVGETDGLVIANNTLVRADGAGGSGYQSGIDTPTLQVAEASKNVSITGNVTSDIRGYEGQSDWVVEDNLIIQDHDATSGGYVRDVFVNAEAGAGVGAANYALRDEVRAQIGDVGADWLLQPGGADTVNAVILAPEPADGADTPMNVIRFDGGYSVGPDGADLADTAFRWEFDDGTTATGRVVEHRFTSPGKHMATLTVEADGQRAVAETRVVVDGPDVLSFDADTGMFRVQGIEGDRMIKNGLPLAELEGGGQAMILGQTSIDIAKHNVDRWFGSQEFSFTTSLRATEGGNSAGEFLRLHQSLQVIINGRGEMIVKITPEGSSRDFSIITKGAALTDGAWHDVTVDWNGRTGGIDVVVDGQSLASGTIEGTLKPMASWDMMFGTPWSQNFKGEMRAFDLDVNASAYEYVTQGQAQDEEEEAWLGNDPSPAEGTADPGIFDASSIAPDFATLGADLQDGQDGTARLIPTDEGGTLALSGSGHLPLGRIEELAGEQRIVFSVTFSHDESSDGRGRLIWNHVKLGVELVGDKLKFHIGQEGGGMHRAFTDALTFSDTGTDELTVLVDAETGAYEARLNGETVFEVTGLDLDIVTGNGHDYGWTVGSKWNEAEFEASVSDLVLDTFDPVQADPEDPFAIA